MAPLDHLIIEEIRRREEERRRNEERPQPTVDLPPPREPRSPQPSDESDRGIITIDIFGDDEEE